MNRFLPGSRRTSLAPDLSPATVAQIFILTRAAILLVLISCALTNQDRSFQQMLSGWDVWHFMGIAEHGYEGRITEVAFFPGLPMLLWLGGSIGIPMPLTGALLGLLGTGFATWALYRLGGGSAAALWLIAPTAVFTCVGYSEGLFCAAAFWAWERAQKEHWAQAALLCALGCMLRVSGLFLLGALGLAAMTHNLTKVKDRLAIIFSRLFWLVIPMAVLVGYQIYLWHLTGTWTAWFTAQQSGWQRNFVWPWECLANTLDAMRSEYFPTRPLVPWVFRAEMVSWIVGLITTLVCFIRKRWADGAWVGIQVVAFASSFWLMSVNRAVLLWWPVFIGLGIAARWRAKRQSGRILYAGLVACYVLASFAAMLGWAWLFFTGNWAS